MTFAELVATSRTCRRFRGIAGLTDGILADLVNVARISPSARNTQALRFAVISGSDVREALFPLLTLGGKLAPEQRAKADQHPGGYIVIFGPRTLDNFGLMDVGIAAQSINLAANTAGLACCMIGAFNKPALHKLLDLEGPDDLDAKLVLALGAPDEDRQIAPMGTDGDTAYFHDDKDVHWVPKRSLEELIILHR